MILLSTNSARTNSVSTWTKMTLDHNHKKHLKSITDLNIRAKELLGENTGEYFLWPWDRQRFFRCNTKSIIQEKKTGNFIKMKNFCASEDTINKMKRQSTEWEKIFATQMSDKGLGSKYMELLQLNKTTQFQKKGKRFK